MESLGGDSAWFDRFVAFHSAIVYFWALILFYAVSPKYAYLFSELVEGHATDTYAGTFTSGSHTDNLLMHCCTTRFHNVRELNC